jgi:hypothetical protein
MQHPSLTCYRRGCRQEECVTYNAHYDKRLRYDHARGISRIVDSTQAVEWLRYMLATGTTIHAMSRDMGYTDPNALRALLRRKRIHRTTHDRIMALRPAPYDSPKTAWVPAVGTIRRIHALAAIGWPAVEVIKRTGINQSTISDISTKRVSWVHAATALAVRRVFEELSSTNGGDVRSMTKAKKLRWAPPAAWDDIDNPLEKPKR